MGSENEANRIIWNWREGYPPNHYAERVWAGDHYHYPGIERLLARIAAGGAAGPLLQLAQGAAVTDASNRMEVL